MRTRDGVPTATDGLVSRAPGWRRSDGIPLSPPLKKYQGVSDLELKPLFISNKIYLLQYKVATVASIWSVMRLSLRIDLR